MKKVGKLSILLASLSMAAGVITFSSSKLKTPNHDSNLNGAEYIGEVSDDEGPIFYPASYSVDIEDEPYYSTQNSKSNVNEIVRKFDTLKIEDYIQQKWKMKIDPTLLQNITLKPMSVALKRILEIMHVDTCGEL